jgi:hypothetical protein
MLGMLLMLMLLLLPLLILLRDGSNRASEGAARPTDVPVRSVNNTHVSCQKGVCVAVARLLFEMYGNVQNVSS